MDPQGLNETNEQVGLFVAIFQLLSIHINNNSTLIIYLYRELESIVYFSQLGMR